MNGHLDDRGHVRAETLAEIAGGGRCTAEVARHMVSCASCRRELARRDPSALFALLPALPAAHAAPKYPALVLAPHPAARERVARFALAAAAAIVGVAALVGAGLRPQAPAPRVVDAGTPPARFSVRVDAPAAQVVTLVPPQPEGPPVTLILGLEIDL